MSPIGYHVGLKHSPTVKFGPYDGQDLTDVVQVPEGCFILSTFCDLHLHAPQFLYQGTELHFPLMEWLNEYAFKAEEKLEADSDLAERVYRRLARRLIENGTGAVSLFGTIEGEARSVVNFHCRFFVVDSELDRQLSPG